MRHSLLLVERCQYWSYSSQQVAVGVILLTYLCMYAASLCLCCARLVNQCPTMIMFCWPSVFARVYTIYVNSCL